MNEISKDEIKMKMKIEPCDGDNKEVRGIKLDLIETQEAILHLYSVIQMKAVKNTEQTDALWRQTVILQHLDALLQAKIQSINFGCKLDNPRVNWLRDLVCEETAMIEHRALMKSFGMSTDRSEQ